jgi:serine/threonine-protein kinase RsbW
MDRELVFELPNDLQCIEEAVEFVVGRCGGCVAAAEKLRFNFRVSLTEALANAMIYGNGRDPSKRVRVEMRMRSRALRVRVTDQGHGFDADTVPDPTRPENLECPGGRGIFLMRKLMDEVRYNERGNAVTLTLHLPESGPIRREASA